MIKTFTAFFATKQDISDMKKDITNLKDADLAILKEVFVSREELHELEKRFDKKFDRVLNLVDAVLGEVKTMRIEQVAHLSSHDRFEDRLTIIEASVV